MNNSSIVNKGFFPYFERNDIFLALSILLVCVGPKIGSFSVLVAFVISLVRMFRYDIHTFMFDMMCLMPFANIYKVAPRTPSLVLVLILIGFCWYTIKTSAVKTYTPVIIIACTFLFLRSGFLMDALVSIVCSLALICLFARNVDDGNVVKIAYGYIASVTVSVIVAYVALPSNLYVDYISKEIQVGTFSDAIRFKGLFADPNYLGTYLLSAIGILSQLFIVKKIKINNFLIFFVILIWGGMISYSKSFFLMTIAIFILVVVNLWKSGNRKWAFLFFLAFMVVGIYALQGAFSDVNIVLERFSNDSDADDLTTGRSTLWARYAENIFSSIFVSIFGNGLDAPLLIQGAHNLYLETLYYVGLLGMLLIIISYTSSFKPIIQDFRSYNFTYKCIGALTLIILLVVYWSLQGLFGFATYFQFFIAMLMFRLPLLEKIEKK